MLVINLYGSPGCGKSTTAAYLFYRFKTETKLRVELVTEYAKDLTYDDRVKTLECQPYVFAKQLYKLDRLRDKVDVAITDSPLMLSCLYSQYSENYNLTALKDGYHQAYNTFDNLNLLLPNDKVKNAYADYGRNQSAEESLKLYDELVEMLRWYGVEYLDYNPHSDSQINFVLQYAREN